MGSNARREAKANGKIVESAEAFRRRRRAEASAMREELAIELWAQGKTSAQIAEAMFDRYGVRLTGEIPALVRRGLYRRMQANKPNVDIAREMMEVYFRKFVEVYMPRAIGEGTDDEGRSNVPDLRAAEFTLKVIEKWGQVTGALAPPKVGDVNLHLHQAPPDAENQRVKVMQALAAEHDKQMEIEGALAGTPATEARDHEDALDGMIMPPVPAAPTQER